MDRHDSTHELLTDLSETPTLSGTRLTKFTAIFAIFLNACSVLVGNVKPISEKAESYTIMKLDQAYPGEWKPLESKSIETQASEEGEPEGDFSDFAYQSKKTASIISLNSACRKRNANPELTLRQFTDTLMIDISDVSDREERDFEIDKTPALETVVKGKLNGENVQLKSVVVRRESCVYDLMFVSRPRFFDSEKETFDRFVASLKFQ